MFSGNFYYFSYRKMMGLSKKINFKTFIMDDIYKLNVLQETDYQVIDITENGDQINTNLTNFLGFEQNVHALYTQFGKKINRFSYLAGLDGFHAGHITTQLFTDQLDRVITNFGVYGDQGLVVDGIATDHSAADDISTETCHEVLEHWTRRLIKEVVPVLCCIGDNDVHFVELLACNGVGNQWRLVQRLVVRRLVDDAC